MGNTGEPAERDLPLVVLGEMVIMPHMTVPLQVGQGKSFRAMEQAWDEDREVLLIFVAQNTATTAFTFLAWHWNLPLGVAILLAAVCGGLITALVSAARMYQLRRAAKKNLAALKG